jgi:dienelactone hydrolase
VRRIGHRTPHFVWLAALAALAAGCGPGQGTSEPANPSYRVFSEGDFYRPPAELVPGKPGSIIWAQSIEAPGGASAWRVLYRSRAIDGDPVAVSGIVTAPSGGRPSRGRPLVSYARGTIGIADNCAVSGYAGPAEIGGFAAPYLERGWAAVVTDYEGLGTPGRHPYLVGESEGRSVLDAARAARSLVEAGAGRRYAVHGYSQGGHAALFAGQIARRWAPEMRLVGVAAGAPPSQLGEFVEHYDGRPFLGFFPLVGVGFDAAYAGLDLGNVLDRYERARLRELVDRACFGELVLGFVAFPDPSFAALGPFLRAPWRRALAKNDPGRTPTGAPVLVYHGARDQFIPLARSHKLLRRICAAGTNARLRTYAGEDHQTLIGSAGDYVTAWLADRFAGRPARAGCSR